MNLFLIVLTIKLEIALISRRQSRYLVKIISLFLLFSLSKLCPGQDYHYWSEQFGGEATMMGGAVIASGTDNSMVFYNPGRIGFINSNSISISANVYKVQMTKFRNALGQKNDVGYNRYAFYPQVLARMIPISKSSQWRLGVGLFTRYNSRLLFHEKIVTNYDALPSQPGNELFIGSTDYSNDFNEQWGMVSVAHQLNQSWSIGLSTIAAYRYQYYRSSSEGLSLVNDASATLMSLKTSTDLLYVNWRLLWKFGLAWQQGRWKAGLTITTPTINLYGDADVQSEIVVGGLKALVPSSQIDNLIISDRQERKAIHYKHPLSIGFGLSYEAERYKIELATEYFFQISKYHILSSDPRITIYPAGALPLNDRYLPIVDVLGYNKPLLNLSLGTRYKVSNTYSLYSSLRTDFNNYSNPEYLDDGINLWGREWDLYHLVIGGSRLKNNDMIHVGVEITAGMKSDLRMLSDYNSPVMANLLFSEAERKMKGTDLGFSLIIGYTYSFSK